MRNCFLATGLAFAVIVAHATEIDPGAIVSPNVVGTAVGVPSRSLTTLSGNFVFNPLPADISGSYVETAYADTTNPFNSIVGVFDTTIVLKITVGQGSSTIERVTLGYFGGFETSVSYLNTSAAVPTSATRNAGGSVIGYTFAGLTPGQGETLVIYTNAQGANANGTVSIQDGTAGYNVGLSPAPEPLPANLSVSGLCVLFAIWSHSRFRLSRKSRRELRRR